MNTTIKKIIILSTSLLFIRINAGWLDDLTTFSWSHWAARHAVGIAAHTLLANYVDQNDNANGSPHSPGFAMFAPQIGEWVVGSGYIRPTLSHGAIRFAQIDQELHPEPRLSAWISIPLNIIVYSLLQGSITNPIVRKCELSGNPDSLGNCAIQYTADNITSSLSSKIVTMITHYFRPMPARDESAVARAIGCRTCLHEAAQYAPSKHSPEAVNWQAQGHLTKEELEKTARKTRATCSDHQKNR